MRAPPPPTTHSCHYGIDTPERAKLMAAQHDLEEMARIIGVDSLAFISLDGLYRALGKPAGRGTARAGCCRARVTRAAAAPSAAPPFIPPAGRARAPGKPAGRDRARPGYCDACFTGDYSIPLTD